MSWQKKLSDSAVSNKTSSASCVQDPLERGLQPRGQGEQRRGSYWRIPWWWVLGTRGTAERILLEDTMMVSILGWDGVHQGIIFPDPHVYCLTTMDTSGFWIRPLDFKDDWVRQKFVCAKKNQQKYSWNFLNFLFKIFFSWLLDMEKIDPPSEYFLTVAAGDYVKFGFPFASAMTVLSWGFLTFKVYQLIKKKLQ